MRKIEIRVEDNTAYCDELGAFSTGDTPEDAVRELVELIKYRIDGVYAFKLPYMGQDFSPRWEDIRFRPPPKEDEFEDMQKAYEFPKDKEIL